MSSTPPTGESLRRLVGIYNADGTVFGELAYVTGRAIGRASCALCDITHGTFRKRPEWDSCRKSLGVPFETYHRNDQPAAVRSATGNETPIVVAELSSGKIVTLLDRSALATCARSPQRLMEAIRIALDRAGHPIEQATPPA